MLGIEELLELEDSLRIELNDNLTGILTNGNLEPAGAKTDGLSF